MDIIDIDDDELGPLIDSVQFSHQPNNQNPLAYDVIRYIDEEEANRGFNYEEEGMMNDYDWG